MEDFSARLARVFSFAGIDEVRHCDVRCQGRGGKDQEDEIQGP